MKTSPLSLLLSPLTRLHSGRPGTRAAAYFVILLLLSGAAAAESLPPSCLLSVRINDVGALCRRTGRVLEAVDARWDAAYLRRSLGRRLHNPSLAGVNLSAPVDFFFMNPKKYDHPWVCRFTVTRAQALKRSFVERGAEATTLPDGTIHFRKVPGLPAEGAYLRLDGTQATWSLNREAAKPLVAWADAQDEGLSPVGSVGLSARVDIQRCLRTFDEELAAELQLMKERMREALERTGSAPDVEKDVSRAQAQLETAFGLLHRVREATVDVEFEKGHARLFARILPVPGSALEQLVRSHPQGTSDLLGYCPAEAAFVIFYNLSAAGAARRMILRALGIRGADEALSALLPHSTGTLIAGYLSGDRQAPLEVLLFQEGEQARQTSGGQARGILNRLGIGSAQSSKGPFTVRPSDDQGEPRELVPNERVLGTSAVRVMHRLFGEPIRVAQRAFAERSVLALGSSPLPRLNKVAALADGRGEALGSMPAFQGAVENLASPPNVLVYLSPAAIRGWITWTGPPNETGLAAVLRLSPDGTVEAALHVPTDVLVDALLRRRSAVRPAQPGPQREQSE